MKKINIKSILISFAILVTFFASMQFHLLDSTYWKVQLFKMYDGNYQDIRSFNYAKVDIDLIQQHLSTEDTLNVLFKKEYEANGIRYFVYPIKINFDSLPRTQYNYILCDTSIAIDKNLWKFNLRIKPDKTLYSKTELIKKDNNININKKRFSYYLFITLFLISLTYLIGAGWTKYFDKSNKSQTFFFPVGFVLINLVTIINGVFFNHKPNSTELIIIFSILILPFFLDFKKNLRILIPKIKLKLPNNFILLFLTIISCIGFFHIIFHMLIGPLVSGDAVMHWMFKSKILFHEGYDLSYSNLKWSTHNEYPLFWTNFPYLFYTISGYDFDQIAVWIQIFVLANYYLLIKNTCKKLKFDQLTTAIVIFLSLTLGFINTLASTFAEGIHTLFILFIFNQSVDVIKDNKVNFFLLFIGFVGLMNTKIEGIPQGFLILILIYIFFKRDKNSFQKINFFKPLIAFTLSFTIYIIWLKYAQQFLTGEKIETLGSLNESFNLLKFKTWTKISITDISNAKTSYSMLMGIALICMFFANFKDKFYLFTLLFAILLAIFAQISILSWRLEDIISMHSTTFRLFSHAVPIIIICSAISINKIINLLNENS